MKVQPSGQSLHPPAGPDRSSLSRWPGLSHPYLANSPSGTKLDIESLWSGDEDCDRGLPLSFLPRPAQGREERMARATLDSRLRGNDKEYKRRFQTHGAEGLEDLPPCRIHAGQTPRDEDMQGHAAGIHSAGSLSVIPSQAGIQATQGGLRGKNLDVYLKFYSNERPHQGWRSMGSQPIDTVRTFIQSARKEAWSYGLWNSSSKTFL